MGDRHRAQRHARAGAGGTRVSQKKGVVGSRGPGRRQRQAAEGGGDFRHAGCGWRIDRGRVAGGGGFSCNRASCIARRELWKGEVMSTWTTVVIVLHVVVALAIIGLVLLQHGKGADMGSGFGGGASGSLFGATGSGEFLSRTTAGLAAGVFSAQLPLRPIPAQRRDAAC